MIRRQRTVDISALIRRKVCTISLSPEKGCAAPDKEYLLELTDGLLPLDIHSFDNDALILENSQVKEVTLYNKEKKPYLSLYFEHSGGGVVVASGQECSVCLHRAVVRAL